MSVSSAEFGTMILQIYYFIISFIYFDLFSNTYFSTGRSSKGNERETEERIEEA